MSDPRVPSLSVIVLNFKNPGATVRCLESIEASAYPAQLDVVVLENGSGDDSWTVLTAFAARTNLALRLLRSEANLGFAGGVNRAWGAARGEFVCLVNNDAQLHRDCLKRLATTLAARRDLGAVWPCDAPAEWAATRQVPDAGDLAGLRNGTNGILGANIWLPLLRDYRECFTASGVCLMLRRADHDLPFLDEYFAYYEDVYLGWRLRLRGLGCERVLQAVIYHEGSATARREAPLRALLAFHAEKNRLVNLLVFYQPRTLVRIAPLLVLDELAKLLSAAARNGLGVLLSSRWWVLGHWRWILSQRRRIQAERCVPDRPIVDLLSARLTMKEGMAARLLNGGSLAWCRLVGLRTCERRPA